MKPVDRAASWEDQRERSNPFWVGWLAWIARHVGRQPARWILAPTVLYFLCFGSSGARRCSRHYLRRVLQRPPRLRDVARHFHTFAACTLDRVLLLGGRLDALQIAVHRDAHVRAFIESRRGCVLLLAHVGSFESIRALGGSGEPLPLRVVLDRAHGQVLTGLLERLNPALSARVIDAGERGPALVLALREAVAAGDTVCLMADRAHAGEPSVPITLLGAQAQLPAAPWILAGVLGVPVLIAFSLYRGGARYDAYCELFAERIELPRAQRSSALAVCAQAYAARLEHYLREAPYNWFNFYPFWEEDRE